MYIYTVISELWWAKEQIQYTYTVHLSPKKHFLNNATNLNVHVHVCIYACTYVDVDVHACIYACLAKDWGGMEGGGARGV